MPNFHTVSGSQAWSDKHFQNTSQRVDSSSSTKRPEAEYRLKNRKIEIRTGARVTRARGAWTSFKRGLTNSVGYLPSWLGGLSKAQRSEQGLRHAEYRFDRHVNMLVEDMANNPNLSQEEVDTRMDKIRQQSQRMSSSGRMDTQRLAKNVKESLAVVQAKHPDGLKNIKANFGKLADYQATQLVMHKAINQLPKETNTAAPSAQESVGSINEQQIVQESDPIAEQFAEQTVTSDDPKFVGKNKDLLYSNYPVLNEHRQSIASFNERESQVGDMLREFHSIKSLNNFKSLKRSRDLQTQGIAIRKQLEKERPELKDKLRTTVKETVQDINTKFENQVAQTKDPEQRAQLRAQKMALIQTLYREVGPIFDDEFDKLVGNFNQIQLADHYNLDFPHTDGNRIGRVKVNGEMKPQAAFELNGRFFVRTGKVIGKGSYGAPRDIREIVHTDKGWQYKSDQPLVNKRVGINSWKEQTEMFNEIRVQKQLGQHPNVMVAFDAYQDPREHTVRGRRPSHDFGILMEKGGQTLDKLQNSKQFNPNDPVWGYMHDSAEGLKHMHDQNVVHNDFKFENTLVGPQGQAQVFDFGLSRTPEQFQNHQDHGIGHNQIGGTYFPPEAVKYRAGELDINQVDMKKVDSWGFGVQLVRALGGPFLYHDGRNRGGFDYNVTQGPNRHRVFDYEQEVNMFVRRTLLRDPVTPEKQALAQLIRNTVKADPEKRWDMDQILASDFFKNREM